MILTLTRPKPLPFVHPKPARLPTRKAVTIGIGFYCRDGIVLAADQQQTMQGYYKVHTSKIGNIVYGDATILWTYAYLPNLVTVMKDGVFAKLPSGSPRPKLTLNQIAEAISKQIAEMKSQYPEEMAQQQFLLAASCGSGLRFFRVTGGIVDEPHWGCIGVGDSSLVNFIYKSLNFGPPVLTHANDALTLAVYMIHLAKQFVDGVGGPTDAVILRYGSGTPFFIPSQQIEHLEKKFEDMQYALREVYNILTNTAISDEDSERLIEKLAQGLRNLRKLT